ncbi:uncharacterized protein LOC130975065 [Arachis stenosperma]|uniref:uncharacterized protein LOC130975065 n=1 Tax=Arachis stenosperma TaxID=217475 RepID=UPI0025ACFBCE|nr:uncharacterized protein LOC130975065 [Arachis stenosperma]
MARQDATMKNLKRQVGQLARQLAKRPTNTFPSDTIPNPREECKAVQLRSGKIVGEYIKDINKEATKPREDDKIDYKNDKETQPFKKGKEVMKSQPEERKGGVKPYVPKLPYPQRLHKEIRDQRFPKFLKIFRKLEINIPLAEALEQMPLYAKFLKELISKKRSWQEKETVVFTQEEEVKPIRMSLQLADRSLKIPNGVVENLLVKVGKFIFPSDFVILNMDEEGNNSIILGRPFLATARAIIDVEKGKMVLRVHEEQMVINVFKAMQYPTEKENCMRIDMVDTLVEEELEVE